MQKSHWCFTINNPEDGDFVTEHPLIQYLVYQLERGDNGTKHIQGYVEFKRTIKLGGVKKLFPRAHLEPRMGTRDQARAYAMKEDTRLSGPYEHGEWKESQQGKRNDLLEVQEKLKTGASLKRIADEHFAQWVRYEKSFKKYKAMLMEDKPSYASDSFNVELRDLSKPLLITGEPGTGKTSFALSHFGNPLLVSQIDDLQKLEDDHDGIVFDDMSFRHWPVEAIIHLLDIEQNRSIRNRFQDAIIPKGMKRIFTHNHEDIFFPEGISEYHIIAVKRRFNVFKVTESLINH